MDEAEEVVELWDLDGSWRPRHAGPGSLLPRRRQIRNQPSARRVYAHGGSLHNESPICSLITYRERRTYNSESSENHRPARNLRVITRVTILQSTAPQSRTAVVISNSQRVSIL